MSYSQNNRIVWLDFLKAFAIFLVVWGHCIQRFNNENNDDIVYQFIYSFHMPLFMCVSGFFGARLLSQKIYKILYKKSYQLLLPAFVFSVLACIYKNNFSSLENLSYELKNAFWFLKSAFVCSFLYIITYRIIGYVKIKATVIVDLFILILTIIIFKHIQVLALDKMYPSFLVGTFIYKYHSFLVSKENTVIISSLILFGVTFYLFNDVNTSGIYTNYILSLIIGISATLALIFSFNKMSRVSMTISTGRTYKLIAEVGTMTLGIYCIHYFILLELKKYIDFQNIKTVYSDMIYTPIISVLIIAVCYLIIKFIRKSNIISFIFLGERIVK